jgi:hypothetical protein
MRSGNAEMLVSTRTPTVSTLSAEWTGQMKQTASFSNVNWDGRANVDVVTLNDLIGEFGLPVFCKLDIEGYEGEALKGLNRPIRTISFEYLPGAKDRSAACIKRLQEIGDYRFTYIKGEYPRLALPSWILGSAMNKLLMEIPKDGRAGEVYARLQTD